MKFAKNFLQRSAHKRSPEAQNKSELIIYEQNYTEKYGTLQEKIPDLGDRSASEGSRLCAVIGSYHEQKGKYT